MYILSLQAIFLFYGLFLVSTAALMIWLFRRQADLSARLWIAATLMSAAATSVTAWRTELPEWLGYLLPNAIEFGHATLTCLAVRALMGPVPQLGRMLAVCLGVTVLMALGLSFLSTAYRGALVPYVSLANGLAYVPPALLLQRRLKGRADARLLRVLLHSVMLMGLLWLLRVPVFFMDLGAHAMDPKWANWLIFVTLLLVGILVQFVYIGVRFSNAYESRMALERMRQRLDQVLLERDALLRRQHAPSGALASQIAHEINQPLAAIRLSLESAACKPLYQMPSAELDGLLGDIDRISACLERARHLTAGPSPELRLVPDRELMTSLSLAAHAAGISVRFGRAAGLWLRCDPGLLSAACVAALQGLVDRQVCEVDLSLVAEGAERVRLRMRTPSFDSGPQQEALNVARLPQAAPARAADAFLDMLTLEHLVRAHAGHLSVQVAQGEPVQFQVDLVLPGDTGLHGLAPGAAV